MTSLYIRLRNKFSRLLYRKNYYLSKIIRPHVPPTPLRNLPAGFTVHTIAKTGIKVIENFCTKEEADYIIETARKQQRLDKSQVIIDGKPVDDPGRTSNHTIVFHRHHQDPEVLKIIARGAMLTGVPQSHAEQVYVTRYSEGEVYHGHYDFSADFQTCHRLCTTLIYLNTLDVEQGGTTYFRDLNIASQPTVGRAVTWTNMNPDGTWHRETLHAALPPVGKDTEKWVIQLWFRPYEMHPIKEPLEALQAKPGIPLTGNETLPDGLWFPSQQASD
jgi:hypothetical protein